MVTLYVLSLVMLVAGGLLCYMGIKLYKYGQMLMCGAIGGYIGLILVNALGRQEFYILAIILTALGAFLGYKYYKYSLYLFVSISAYAVTFSYFWKQAVSVVNETVQELVSAKSMITENLSGAKSLQETLDSFDIIMGLYNSNWALVIKNAGDIIKHGLFISAAVAIVAGILTRLIGDYVIMAVTAGFGAMLLVNLIELYMEVAPMMHLLLLVVIGLSGVIVQNVKCRRR